MREQSGVLLDFENDPPGHDIGDDDGPCIVFDHEDMDSYNIAVGVPVEVYNSPEPDWENFTVSTPEKSVLGRLKFWGK